MLRTKLRSLRIWIADLTRQERQMYIILFCIVTISIIGLINISEIGPTAKIVLAIVSVAIVTGFALCIHFSSRANHLPDENTIETPKVEEPKDEPSEIPPKPERLPTLNVSDDDVNRKLLTVLESIAQSNKDTLERQKQADEERRLRQEEFDQLVNSKTIHYDTIPGRFYFIKRGLWKMALGWIGFLLILVISISATGGVIEGGLLVTLVLLFCFCTWLTIRSIGDWRWTHRRIVGIRVVVNQAKNAFFLLFGNDYEVSIFDCGNTAVIKAKYERLLHLKTATVSIDTKRKNTEDDDTTGDVFNALENMRRPYEFRDIVMNLHERLTMSQSNTIKRSE